MESLPGGLSALGRIPPSAADKSRLWVGHARRADITGRGRSEGTVFKSDQGPACLLHYATREPYFAARLAIADTVVGRPRIQRTALR